MSEAIRTHKLAKFSERERGGVKKQSPDAPQRPAGDDRKPPGNEWTVSG